MTPEMHKSGKYSKTPQKLNAIKWHFFVKFTLRHEIRQLSFFVSFCHILIFLVPKYSGMNYVTFRARECIDSNCMKLSLATLYRCGQKASEVLAKA